MMNQRKRSLAPLAVALIVAGIAWADVDRATKLYLREFNAEVWSNHVKYLASDELEGRLPGTEGSQRAAEYIIEKWKEAGVQPGGADGGWLQPFEVRQGKQLAEEEALLEVEGMPPWRVREDWMPFPFTELEAVEGELAFAGYGIEAASNNYDDYGDFDAAGKILLILRYEPKDEDPEAGFGGSTPSRHALFTRKARVAAKHGAKALLVVNPPNRDPDKDEMYEFNAFNSQQTERLPMVHIKRSVADALLAQAKMPTLKELQEKLDAERKSLTRDMGLKLRLNPGVKINRIMASNVLGLIPGESGVDEYIVVGAHRDHLGKVPRQFQRGDGTPQIHNGADDNASGTAALIELGRSLMQEPHRRRNVLLIAFDGEEMGLLGSFHYVSEPTVPLERIKAMINFDMISRLSQDKYTVFGTESSDAFPELVKTYAEAVEVTYKAPGGMAGGSDHTPFLRKRIPAMFGFTGMHREYHQPEDDWEHIDAEGGAKVLRMWHGIIMELVNMESGPTYREASTSRGDPAPEGDAPVIEIRIPGDTETQPAEKVEQKKGEQRPGDDGGTPPSRREIRVRLGVVPDMTRGEERGLAVESVVPDAPAAVAGMKAGDRIIKIGEEEIRDIYAYMRALQAFNPGDEVDIVVVREGKELTLHVKLDASRPRERG